MADKDKPVTPDWDTGADDGYHGLGVPFEQDEPYKNPNQRGLEAFALYLLSRAAMWIFCVVGALLLTAAFGVALWAWLN